MKIKSFSDANRRLADVETAVQELREFMDVAMNAMVAVSTLRGDVQPITPTASNHNNVPASWTDRVLELYRQSDKPLMQKDAAERYRELGWPGSDSADLYQKLSSAIAYLHNRKKVLEKTDQGYAIKK